MQRVVPPGSPVESWTVLGGDDIPVEPVERYLAYLSAIERSPNTVRAYGLMPSTRLCRCCTESCWLDGLSFLAESA